MRRSAYALLILALAVVGVSMGAHQASAEIHSAPGVFHLEAGHDHSAMADVSEASAPLPSDHGCATCGPDGGHALLVMSCVFLAVLSLVFVARALVSATLVTPSAPASTAPPPGRAADRSATPELTELCVNRQ